MNHATHIQVVYLSGPISGIENGNQEAFAQAEARLARKGATVVNPHKVCSHFDQGSTTWVQYMQADIKAMMDCDSIYMLRGWENSTGARIEHGLAKDLHYRILYEAGR